MLSNGLCNAENGQQRAKCFLVFTRQLLYFFGWISHHNTVPLRKAFGNNGSCPYNRVGAQVHSGQNDGIHGNPTILPDDNIFSALMFADIGQIVIRGDKSGVGGNKAAFSQNNFCADSLKIVADSMKILHIIRVEYDIPGIRNPNIRRNRPWNMGVSPEDLLTEPALKDPGPADAEMPAVEVPTGQIFFVIAETAESIDQCDQQPDKWTTDFSEQFLHTRFPPR